MIKRSTVKRIFIAWLFVVTLSFIYQFILPTDTEPEKKVTGHVISLGNIVYREYAHDPDAFDLSASIKRLNAKLIGENFYGITYQAEIGENNIVINPSSDSAYMYPLLVRLVLLNFSKVRFEPVIINFPFLDYGIPKAGK